MSRLMNVPKWLIPVVSVVAALAVAVSMGFVGANFASKTTTEVAAKTEIVPVIGPAAAGVTTDQAKALLSGNTQLTSPKIGNKRVTLPGALPSTTPLQREVERIADGGATTSTPTPSPSPSPLVVPYVPEPSNTDDDPCAPVDTKIPIGCPGGLHSAIFADSAPPALDYTGYPFSPTCGTTPVHTNDPTRVNVSVLIEVTQAVSFDVEYWAPTSRPFDGWRELDDIQPNPISATAYLTAIHANAAPSDIPLVDTCVTLPNLILGQEYYYEVVLHATDGTRPGRTSLGFNTSGILTDQPLQVATFGNDGLVVYGDYRDNEQLSIRAFTSTSSSVPSTACDHTYFPTELTPVLTENNSTVYLDPNTNILLDEPTDLHRRIAYGFEAPAGSTVIICGRWFPASPAPSWTRTTALRTSIVTAQAPDAILPTAYVSGNGWYHNPTAANVTVTMATAEGEPCGHAVIYRGETDLAPGGALACDLHGSGSEVDTRRNYLTNVGFAGDLQITVTVNYLDGHSGSATTNLPTSEERPTSCIESDPRDPCGHLEDVYEVDIPYYFLPNHPDPNDGRLGVVVKWNKYGNSNLDQWVVVPETLQVPDIADPDSQAPLLDTDLRAASSTFEAPQMAEDVVPIKSNTDADFTVSLVGLNGSGCSIYSQALTASGHVQAGITDFVAIPYLCFGSMYLATVTLTNSHGTTVWGHDNPGSGWLGYLVTMPLKSETLFVQETVNAGAGRVVQYADFTIGGQEIDPTHQPASCYSSGNLSADRHSFRLPETTTLHIHYQLRAGSRISSGACDLTRDSHDPAPVDADFPINLTTLAANPAGMTITQGPVTVLIREFVDP
jgi:hypothetical protein